MWLILKIEAVISSDIPSLMEWLVLKELFQVQIQEIISPYVLQPNL